MLLNTEEYTNYPYETKGLGENMALVSQVISGWWKPRFLLNHNTKCAYEFMDSNEKLTTVTQDDIAWDTLYGIPKIAIERAKRFSAHFPTFIHEFKNGMAKINIKNYEYNFPFEESPILFNYTFESNYSAGRM
jgi:hypothetical protein